jgi:hypothetical protein
MSPKKKGTDFHVWIGLSNRKVRVLSAKVPEIMFIVFNANKYKNEVEEFYGSEKPYCITHLASSSTLISSATGEKILLRIA